MAANEISRNYTNRYCLFVIDDENDIELLPTSTSSGKLDLSMSTPCAMGSRANCIANGNQYILNGANSWVIYNGFINSGSEGDSGTSQNEGIEPIDDNTIELLF